MNAINRRSFARRFEGWCRTCQLGMLGLCFWDASPSRCAGLRTGCGSVVRVNRKKLGMMGTFGQAKLAKLGDRRDVPRFPRNNQVNVPSVPRFFISAFGSQSVVVDVRIPAAVTHIYR